MNCEPCVIIISSSIFIRRNGINGLVGHIFDFTNYEEIENQFLIYLWLTKGYTDQFSLFIAYIHQVLVACTVYGLWTASKILNRIDIQRIQSYGCFESRIRYSDNNIIFHSNHGVKMRPLQYHWLNYSLHWTEIKSRFDIDSMRQIYSSISFYHDLWLMKHKTFEYRIFSCSQIQTDTHGHTHFV